MEASWWERELWGRELGLLMGGAKLSKSLIQFSVDGWDCLPSLLFDLRLNYGRGNEDNGNLLQKVLWSTVVFSAPDAIAGHCGPTPLLETPRHWQASLAELLVGTLFLSPGSRCAQVLFVPSKSLLPQSYVSSVIKSHCPPISNSMGVLCPFVRSPGWEICCGS